MSARRIAEHHEEHVGEKNHMDNLASAMPDTFGFGATPLASTPSCMTERSSHESHNPFALQGAGRIEIEIDRFMFSLEDGMTTAHAKTVSNRTARIRVAAILTDGDTIAQMHSKILLTEAASPATSDPPR